MTKSGLGDLDLVIFDCDGVLVDSEVISNEALTRALSSEGLAMTLQETRRDFQGLLLADIAARAEAELGRKLPGDWPERYERDRDEAFRRELRPVSGAAEAVQRISAAGVAICVGSQAKLKKIRLSLGLTGLRDLFDADALFSSYSVPRGKPYPDVFLHAAAAMNAEPSRSVVVEDSVSGVTAAVSAGMRVFGYVADSDEQALRAAGAETLRSLEELPSLLGVS
ncbi:MAG TPA: HAD-IA family hydrolase [Solirubrobacteraceae bacterium]|jgi:HAD superfamily hydrolase (TIGR01509 family)|nr:HAD-IA family hydrolase [Solirubrobacteraceae bacterium]